MRLVRTAAHMLPWALIAAQSWLLARLLKQHEQGVLAHNELRERLNLAEQHLDAIRSKADTLSSDTSPSITYHTVTLNNERSFEVAIDPQLSDPISSAVAAGDSWFLDDYAVLLDLMQPGDTVLDLGGHIGTFSLAAAALGCRVVCVEASPGNVTLLQASVTRNNFANMQVIHGAVTDHEGTLEFVSNGPWGTIANATVDLNPSMIYSNVVPSSQLGRKKVPALTVDALLERLGWERVDFIKMDVEGSEGAAIRGMTRLLARPDAPVLLYESNGHALHFFGQTPAQLTATLHNFGYTSYSIEQGQLVPLRPTDFHAQCVVNCLALKEQPPHIEHRQLAAPRNIQQTISVIVRETFDADTHHRMYIARTLAEADDKLLADPKVTTILTLLCADPNEEVRTAAAWFCGKL